MTASRFQATVGSALEIAKALGLPAHHLHVRFPASGAPPVLTVPASDRRRVVITWMAADGPYVVAVEETDDDGAWTRVASEDVAAEGLTATVVRLAKGADVSVAIEPTAVLTPDPAGLVREWIEGATSLDVTDLPPDLVADLTSCASRVLLLLGPLEGQP